MSVKMIQDRVDSYGYNIEIADRSNTDIAVQKAFLKDDSIGKVVRLRRSARSGPLRKIRIRIEIDTNPPDGSGFEVKYVDFPFVSSVTVQDKASLFAGKVHALLCRKYVKGRDWYDFLWYTSQGSRINCRFLASAIDQQGPWQGRNIEVDLDWCTEQLRNKITSIDWTAAKKDVRRFVKASELPSVDLWRTDLFLAQLGKMK